MSTRLRLVLAIACAALTVLASYAYAQDQRRQEAQLRQETLERYGGEVVSLVVASHTLDAGQTITEGDVTLKEWVAELAPEDALVSLDEAVGSTSSGPVSKGQVLTQLSLSSTNSSLEIPSGMVAVSLALSDKLALVTGVDAGSRVFAYRVTEDGAQLLSSRVTVVSVTSEGGLSSSKDVTVAARPADIPALLDAAADGSLRLVVPASNVNAASEGVTPAPSVVEPELDGDDTDDAGSEHENEAASDDDAQSASENPVLPTVEGDGDGRE